MSVGVKVTGSWKAVDDISVRVGGVWKPVEQAYVKVGGVWKELLGSSFKLKDILASVGATPTLCLDAADLESWPGSGDKWLDVSGGGYDFYRGTGTSGDSAEPTFNGTPGDPTAYWSFDGGDYFRYDGGSAEAWINAMHQNDAIFTMLFAVFIPSTWTTSHAITGDTGGGAASTLGFHNFLQSDRTVNLQVADNGQVMIHSSTTLINTNAWNFIGWSVNEPAGAGGSFLNLNGNVEVFDGTYTSPASTASTSILEIGARGGGSSVVKAGTGIAAYSIISGTAITTTQMEAIRTVLMGRL